MTNNVMYLPIPKESLSKQEVEKALKVIYQAWDSNRGARIPNELLHLSDNQWQMLEQMLEELMTEQEQSQVH